MFGPTIRRHIGVTVRELIDETIVFEGNSRTAAASNHKLD
jgi:hypothetical protein